MGDTRRKYAIGETPVGIWVRTKEHKLSWIWRSKERIQKSSEDCIKIESKKKGNISLW